MAAPGSLSAALPNLLSQTWAFPEHSNPSPTTPTSLRNRRPTTTAEPRSDIQKEREMLTFLENSTRSGGWNPLPPYIPVIIKSADDLATTALNSWEMLCGEIGCHRAIFKFCCTSQGTFNNNLFQSYCNKLRLIHNSLCCGLLVALRALLDQLRVWLQIGAATTRTGHSLMPDHKVYLGKLVQLTTTLQYLEQNVIAVRFPDAVVLAHDTDLMREVFAQPSGETGSII